MASSMLNYSITIASKPKSRLHRYVSHDASKLWARSKSSLQRNSLCRRQYMFHVSILSFSLLTGWSLFPFCVDAEEKQTIIKSNEDEGIFDAVKTLFDPNEKTKSGRTLPKAYLKSAREVVKTLRESLEENSKDVSKFRRTADSAKESIRSYINDWRGQSSVSTEESYIAIEKAIRTLAGFYSKAGPFANMPEDIKSSILSDLSTAESFL